jgi:hypothetical protein
MLKYLNGINNNTNMRKTKMQQMQQARRLKMLNRNYGIYPTPMEELSGMGKAKFKQKIQQAKAKVQQAKAKVQQAKTQVQQKAKAIVKKVDVKKIVKTVAKVGLAPARAAFLTMVKFNILGIAKQLAQAYKINPAKVDNFWKGLSGNPAELKKNVSQGSKQQISGLGAVAATVTAAATPIVVKLMSLLKSMGITDPKALLQKGAKAGIKALANKKGKNVKFENKEVPESQAEETQVSVEKTIPTPSETPTSEESNNREVETESSNVRTANKLPLETVQVRDSKDGAADSTPASGGKNKMLIPLLIAGGIGAFFLFKKK